MSRVIIESKPGDALYVLESFNASPCGLMFSMLSAREFIVGQRVKYISFRWNYDRDKLDSKNFQPTWMIIFEANGERYEATHDYFITQEAWAGLMKVFGNEVKNTKPVADNNSTTRNLNWLLTVLYIIMIGVFLWLCAGGMFLLRGGIEK